MRFGLGATVTSDIAAKMFYNVSSDVAFFVPKNEESKQFIYFAHDIAQKPTAVAQNFLNLTKELCKSGKLFK